MSKDKHVIKAQWFKTNTDKSERNLGLDIARTACTLIVICMHTNNFMRPFFSGYKYFFPIGFIAQDLFFALSGFLVGKQILKYINTSTNALGLLKFYKNRWLRIVPLYWLFLIINAGLFYSFYKYSALSFFKVDFKIVDYVFFLQNFAWPHPGFFPEVWPLAIEEWSFLLLPLPIFALVKLLKKPLSNKQLITLIILEIVLINLVRIHYVLNNNPETDWELRKIVVYRLDALLYGFLTLLLILNFRPFLEKNKNWLLVIGLIGSIFIYFVGLKFHPLIYKSLLFSLVPICCSAMLIYFYFTNFSFIKNKLKSFITHISLVSYSLLLTHLYFLQFLLLCFFKPANLFEAFGFAVIYFATLGIVSTALFNCIERPLLIRRNS